LLGIEHAKEFMMGSDGVLRFKGRVYVPNSEKLKRLILEEGQKIRLSMHPSMTLRNLSGGQL